MLFQFGGLLCRGVRLLIFKVCKIGPFMWLNLCKKYDHVSTHHNNLNWLPISHQIKFRSIHAVPRYYCQCYCWIHPSNLVGSTLTKHAAERTLQVLLCVVLLVLKDIFVLLPAPGGIFCPHTFMITIWTYERSEEILFERLSYLVFSHVCCSYLL